MGLINSVDTQKSLWRVIAKNELKVRTSFTRNHRGMFFAGLFTLLAVWATFLAPLMFDQFMPTLAEADLLAPIIVPAIGIIIESLLMMAFLMLMIYPLNSVYKKTEIGLKESLVASPASASDIFLGEFFGKLPLLSMLVLLFSPVIVGLINPLVDLTLIQQLVIYGCVFGVVFMANLIGSILSSWVEHKITKSEKARDLGQILIWVITILSVVALYSAFFFFQFLLDNPELRNWLIFNPSMWFSNIILYGLEPSLLEPYILDIWASSLLAIGVPIIVLYLSATKADKFYSLESGMEKTSSIIAHENVFYKFSRKISGQKWGGLVATQFKGLFRRKDNIARIAYAVGLVGFISWFMSRDITDYMDTAVMSSLIIIVSSLVVAMMIGHLIFIDSKDMIWAYKRSPRGINGLVYSYLITMLILNMIITGGLTVFLAIMMEMDFVNAIVYFILGTAFTQLAIIQATGIQCFSPAFEIKGKDMSGNVMMSMVLQQVPLFLVMFGLFGSDLPVDPILARIAILGPIFLISIATSIPVFYFGLKKLNKIE